MPDYDDVQALLAYIDRLEERLHKADGMANEINILTQEVRRLERQAAAIERLRSSGYHADFYWQAEQAFEAIKAYMSGRPFRQIELTLAGRMAEAFK